MRSIVLPPALLLLSTLAAPAAAQTNVLILLADDLGVDYVGAYGEGSDPPPTPNIDSIAAGGVLFRNAWSNPGCSPTRATILTGRYARRTGIGWIVPADQANAYPLSPAETTLPELLDLGTDGAYAHGCFGKWHLSSGVDGWPHAPNKHGWGWFEGSKANLLAPDDYFQWLKVTNGVEATSTVYATTDTVDSFLAWVAQQPEPWLAYVPFHAPHDPFHAPPAALHTQDLSQAGTPTDDPVPYYKAMVEALDTEIGRLLAGLGPALSETMVIFLGDNGTASQVVLPPWSPSKAKGTVYEGGVNVPLIVAGPPVTEPGSECQALVNTTDVWATVAQLAGAELTSLPGLGGAQDLSPPTQGLGGAPPDSVSLLPYLKEPALPSIREFVYTEVFKPNGFAQPYDSWSRAVRSGRFKLVQHQGAADELYDLQFDPFETFNLLEVELGPAATQAYARMLAYLAAL